MAYVMKAQWSVGEIECLLFLLNHCLATESNRCYYHVCLFPFSSLSIFAGVLKGTMLFGNSVCRAGTRSLKLMNT